MIAIILAVLFVVNEDIGMERQVVDLLNVMNYGVLSTLYEDVPYGSSMPYMLDFQGRPVVYISEMAIHTKNINKNAKCSLTVISPENDVFNSPRITVLGEMKQIRDKNIEKAYFDKYPQAKRFKKLHGFNFYILEIKELYYVGGFGNIGWVDKNDYVKLHQEVKLINVFIVKPRILGM